MKKLRLYLASFLALTLVAGCGGGGNDTPPPTGTTNKVVTIANDIELSSMDTGVATDGTAFEAIAATIEGLYTLDADGNAIMAIAAEEEVSEDGLTYTFKLKDAKWDNGTEVTANDFVFAWSRLADPATASEYSYMIGVAGIKNGNAVTAGEKPITDLGITAVDDKTLKVELDYPVPFFNQLMAFPSFYPINEEFYNQFGDQYALTPEALLSNGPFKLDKWNQGANYEMVKNENYHDVANVKIDGLNFQIVKDAQSAMVAFEQGSVDYVRLTGELVDQYKDAPEYTITLGGYLWYISPNQEIAGLENANLRRAMALSYDKELIANNVLKDGSIAADFVIPVKLAVGPDGKDFRETTEKYLAIDKAKALEYFELAKKELGKDTFTFEFLFEDTEASKKVAEFIKSEVETTLPGLTLELKQQPKKARLQAMQNSDYQLGLTRWGPDYADPMTYLDMWVSNASYNYGHWSNAEYDTLINDASKGELAGKIEERWEALKKAEKLVLDEAAVLPVYQTGTAIMIRDGVKGFEFHSVGVPTIYKNLTKE